MEPETRKRKVVNLKVIHDNEVGEVAQCLSKLLNKDTGTGYDKSQVKRTRSQLHKIKEAEDDGDDEVLKLMDEKLPEEYLEHPTNKLSEGLLDEEEGSQFGLQTPKKKDGMLLKAQESASKYCVTPQKNETPSKLRSRKGDVSADVPTPTKTPVSTKRSVLKSTGSRLSFGGEIGATPSKGNTLSDTPRRSALKTSRSIKEGDTPQRSLRRMSSNESFTPRSSLRRPSMAPIDEDTTSILKTPHSIRMQTKACIRNAIINSHLNSDSESEASVEDDCSEEEDEYVPEGEESSEEEIENDDKENSETDEDKIKFPGHARKSALTAVKKDHPITPSRSRREEVQYEFVTDAYFETFASKNITSNNTLSRLRNPRLREDTLRDLLKDTDVGHKEPLAKLTNDHHTFFHRWIFTLGEGFNILLYGIGSKRHLIQTLHDEMLCDCQVLVVNGFFPGLTIKEILDTILTDLLGVKDAPANQLEAVELIETIQCSRHADTLYLLIHNLDGPSLRNNKAQTVLSKLARIPNVRLIASIDHINAPLMWDQTKLHRFNFSWWDVTTFLPYSVETSFESSLLVQRSGALQLSSLHSVFKSLTANAKKIYLMITKHQLENADDHSYTGFPFQDLYWVARNAFVVSTQMQLRSHLTEFVDHHMVKIKRGGEEALIIPIDNNIIRQFVQAQEEKES